MKKLVSVPREELKKREQKYQSNKPTVGALSLRLRSGQVLRALCEGGKHESMRHSVCVEGQKLCRMRPAEPETITVQAVADDAVARAPSYAS